MPGFAFVTGRRGRRRFGRVARQQGLNVNLHLHAVLAGVFKGANVGCPLRQFSMRAPGLHTIHPALGSMNAFPLNMGDALSLLPVPPGFERGECRGGRELPGVDLIRKGRVLCRIDHVGGQPIGYSCFLRRSGEDGILHYLLSLLGTSTRTLVDLGASQLHGSNTANLLV